MVEPEKEKKEKKKGLSGDEVSKILSDLNTVLEGQPLTEKSVEPAGADAPPPQEAKKQEAKKEDRSTEPAKPPKPAPPEPVRDEEKKEPKKQEALPSPPLSQPKISKPSPQTPQPAAVGEEQFPLCYLYPQGQEPALVQFQKNLMEAVKKNTKTPLELVSRFQTAYAPAFQVDLSIAAGNAKGAGAVCALVLLPAGLEATAIRHAAEAAFSRESMPVLFTGMEEIQKRLIYVDLAIEIFLHRRKKG